MNYVLTVTEVNKYIKEIISKDIILSNLWVKGEISNYKYHYSGHMYFTLKDEKSLIKCVMFKFNASRMNFKLENGMKVVIKGYISVFERDGQYQLYAEEIQPEGLGGLYLAFEQLKKKLEKEGLFDQSKKKKIPFLPQSIGIITSPTGSVIRDIIHVISRRFNNVHLKIMPVQVQGEPAAGQIAGAIKRFNEQGCVDVIILARGGGSLEELWAFNEEVVAKSIYESSIPIISAIGHETDYTISDFVADVRAPTPSAAAEIVVPEKLALKEKLMSMDSRMKRALSRNLSSGRMDYEKLRERVFRQPYNRVYQEKLNVDGLSRYIYKWAMAIKDKSKYQLSALAGKLNSLSPLNVLSRGYAIVQSQEDGKLIKSILDIKQSDRLMVSISDGKIDCEVKGTQKEVLG